jgi:uncharacterized protein (DUF1800 family)
MDRNDFFQSVFCGASGKKEKVQIAPNLSQKSIVEDFPFTGGINAYAGTWTDNEVIHLLKRLTFGAPVEQVSYFKNLTFQQTLDELINTNNAAANIGVPIKTYSTNLASTPANDPDWAVPLGRTWVNTPTDSGAINTARRLSLKAWWLNAMINQPGSIEEKMILFWSTHFAIEFDTVSTSTLAFQYLQTLREHCLGNLKAFTKAITLNPAMLVYLNGNLNSKTAPDENYGRELQELFTLGKGPESLYTEDDVKAAARVLTGYQVNRSTATSFMTQSRHDTNPKQFSSFYNNNIINRPIAEAELELDDLMDMIFAKEEVSKYICRRLYRFFVYDDITADTETSIIAPLAATLRANNYELKPILSQLFKSEHFYDVLQFGAMIKSPVDFTVGLIRECKITFPPASNPQLLYRHIGYTAAVFLPTLGQDLGDPPNVSGFPAYYQIPLFDKIWINTDTFSRRQGLIATLISTGYSNGGFKLQINVVDLARRMSDPTDPNQLVLDFNKYLLRRTLSQSLRDSIKTDILLTGQASDHYWSDAWVAYINNPADANNLSVINSRLKNLTLYFLSKLEEYHLM